MLMTLLMIFSQVFAADSVQYLPGQKLGIRDCEYLVDDNYVMHKCLV